MATEQRPHGLVPLDESRFSSGSAATPVTAGQVIATLGTLPPGKYWVTVGTSQNSSGVNFVNLGLYSNSRRVGVLSSYDGELEAWVIHSGGLLEVRVEVADATANAVYHVDNLTATLYFRELTLDERC